MKSVVNTRFVRQRETCKRSAALSVPLPFLHLIVHHSLIERHSSCTALQRNRGDARQRIVRSLNAKLSHRAPGRSHSSRTLIVRQEVSLISSAPVICNLSVCAAELALA